MAGFDFKQADCSTAAEGYLKVSRIKIRMGKAGQRCRILIFIHYVCLPKPLAGQRRANVQRLSLLLKSAFCNETAKHHEYRQQ